MSTAANGASSDCSVATVRAEKPQAGASGVPFMNRITWFDLIAPLSASRIWFSSLIAGHSGGLVLRERAWIGPPISVPKMSYTRRCCASFPRPANCGATIVALKWSPRSEEQTSELQSLMRDSYDVFGLDKKQ